MYEEICYKKSFLKEVIVRLDFPSPILELEKDLPKKISKVALKSFPLFEPQKTHAQEFQFSGANFQAKSRESIEWVFHGGEREKTLIVTPGSIVFNFKRYISYEKLKDNIELICKVFFESFQDLVSSRIGLRYVNVLDIEKGPPISWSDYINEDILGIIDFNQDKEFLSRIFHILEYNFDGQRLKYQFGIANPDYPATIKRKQFVLDLDSFFHGSFDFGEVFTSLDKAHEKIQEYFEKSITDATRKIMKKA